MNVRVNYDDLEFLRDHLDSIVEEFNAASQRRADLAEAIDQPWGHNRLMQKSNEFETQWDDRRKALREGIEGVSKHVKGVLEGFKEFDTEAASQFENTGE